MTEQKSTEQMLEEHQRRMGSQLGEVYHFLWNDVGWLHTKWLQFRQLYAHSPERIDLLNDVAGHFFGVVQEVLWGDVILHIARLTEKPLTGKEKNLTLAVLPDLIVDPALRQDVADLVTTATSAAAFAKKWRDKHLAHRDFEVALEKGAATLPGISRQAVGRALEAIRAILNRLERHYWQSEVAFSRVLAVGQADDLVHHLHLLLQLEQNESEQIGQGRHVPENLEELLNA